MGIWGLGLESHVHCNETFSDFSHVELEKYSPRYIPRKLKDVENRQVRPYNWPTCYPAVSWRGEGVIRPSLGTLLVDLLQVVKRTTCNTPLITLTISCFRHDAQRFLCKQHTDVAIDAIEIYRGVVYVETSTCYAVKF